MKTDVFTKRTKKMKKKEVVGVQFISKNGLSYDTIGPSGKEYSFSKDTPTLVIDKLDIHSFSSNPELKVFDESSSDHLSIFSKKNRNSQEKNIPTIKNLLTENQIDYLYNTSK